MAPTNGSHSLETAVAPDRRHPRFLVTPAARHHRHSRAQWPKRDEAPHIVDTTRGEFIGAMQKNRH